jgi:hypothetical protein
MRAKNGLGAAAMHLLETRLKLIGAIAQALNDRGIRTARGGQWHVSTVQKLLARAERLG